MRNVELRMNEQYKYQIIKKLVETNGNKKRAATHLDLDIRQIYRLINGYREYGKEFFVHGNRGRKPAHALSAKDKDQIEDLYNSKYFDCTYTQFTEFLAERENIVLSVAEVGSILREREITYIVNISMNCNLLFTYYFFLPTSLIAFRTFHISCSIYVHSP